MKVRAVLAETDGRWTATAQDIDCPPGEGGTREAAVADLREHIATWTTDRGCIPAVSAGR